MCIERKAETCTITYTNAGYMQIVNYDTGELAVPNGPNSNSNYLYDQRTDRRLINNLISKCIDVSTLPLYI